MPPTEQIIWEAKHKPGSLKGCRRSSTAVDATGCKITIGFILPSRPSSRSSSASSSDTQSPGTPASPLEEAIPGFFRPTGSLYHAPEMAVLRSHSDSSLHRPSETGALHRPPQLGGRSNTFNGRRASCWRDEGSSTTIIPAPARDTNSPHRFLRLGKSMRRTKSDHTGLISMQARATTDAPPQSDAARSCAIVGSTDEEENAIASDSDENDDGDDFATTCTFLKKSGIAAQRSRPTYAQRRAMSDQRANPQKHSSPLSPLLQQAQQATAMMVSTSARYRHEEDIETPIEVKSFTYEEMVPHHVLHPSRSRPRPAKGVLKKTGSRSSSEDSVKHVHTAIRRGSGSVVNGTGMLDPTAQMG